MTLKSGIFSLFTKCVFLGSSPGHVQVYHSCLKKYFGNSTKSLDKYFMKKQSSFRFLARAFQSVWNRNSLFSLKKVAKYAKNRFSWLPWKRTGCHEHLLVLFKN